MIPILTIAGSDCSGGAGIQADLKTFSAHGLFGMSVIVSVVAENTATVTSVENVSNKVLTDQIDCVFDDIYPNAVKIGMLPSIDAMNIVTDKLKEYKAKNIVIDPVMYAKNGFPLMDVENINELIRTVIPIADIITPNIPEAEKISDMKINSVDDMKESIQKIMKMGPKAVLVKGGHHIGDAIDVLFDGKDFYTFKTKRINTKNTHGTGCTLSSAIASNLAIGNDVNTSVKLAKDYVTTAIEYSLSLGKGCGPTHHFYDLYKKAGMNND
ncbi:MAG: bifunctional hydroxymethylpyrimidine kinase/phosphomethylpyrimidine kinase [Erysipelotrichaceae bacterium]|nr:bifunctional hydroxymethylpyrimidine kinase/phosphomethylpyrimidine kinase [Erysipelotrichaceae bacterium]